MQQNDIIQTIRKDSDYHLGLLTNNEVDALREDILTQTVRGKETPFIRLPHPQKTSPTKRKYPIMFNLSKEEITFEVIETFCREWQEGVRVEYKQEIKDIPKIVSSFANTQGGVFYHRSQS